MSVDLCIDLTMLEKTLNVLLRSEGLLHPKYKHVLFRSNASEEDKTTAEETEDNSNIKTQNIPNPTAQGN